MLFYKNWIRCHQSIAGSFIIHELYTVELDQISSDSETIKTIRKMNQYEAWNSSNLDQIPVISGQFLDYKLKQNEDTTSIDIAGSKEKTMMKNTTMKMSVNPQESMDKFLQRLEKSVMDFLATGNKAKVGFQNKLFPYPPIPS